jgi:hypothetical protein
MIESRAEELVSAPVPTTPLETLARAHALLLYQIIRFFDGDISLRAGAERGMRALEEAAFSLMMFTTFSEGTFDDMGPPMTGGTLPAAPGPELAMQNIPPHAMRAFWESWVFQESARRTFLMIFFFLRVYKITKGVVLDPKGSCDGKLGLFHSFTASAHLWGANDFVDFAAAWNSKPHLIVKNGEYGSGPGNKKRRYANQATQFFRSPQPCPARRHRRLSSNSLYCRSWHRRSQVLDYGEGWHTVKDMYGMRFLLTKAPGRWRRDVSDVLKRFPITSTRSRPVLRRLEVLISFKMRPRPGFDGLGVV